MQNRGDGVSIMQCLNGLLWRPTTPPRASQSCSIIVRTAMIKCNVASSIICAFSCAESLLLCLCVANSSTLLRKSSLSCRPRSQTHPAADVTATISIDSMKNVASVECASTGNRHSCIPARPPQLRPRFPQPAAPAAPLRTPRGAATPSPRAGTPSSSTARGARARGSCRSA